MIAIQVEDISISFGSHPVLSCLSWQIHDDRIVGLVGANGSGKSTLLKLLQGSLVQDRGKIVRRRGLTIGCLPQDVAFPPGHSVWQEAFSASEMLAKLDDELTKTEAKLADPQVFANARILERTLEHQARLLEQFSRQGGMRYTGLVRSTLDSLGFSESDDALPVEVLSGGQSKLLGLVKLFIANPDLLLLDEPDNHLDLAAKAHIEKLLRGYGGSVVIVSHDRYLLDLVVDEIAEIEEGKLTIYPGNYSEFAFEKEMRRMRQQQLFQAQQKEVHRLEQAARRLLTWGKVFDNEKFSQRGKNILKRLERIERIDKPFDQRQMRLELKGSRSGDKVVEVSNLAKSFPMHNAEGMPASSKQNTILAGVSFQILRGERVGLVGANASGKSLLFRLILGEEPPSTGEIRIGPSIITGYYAQMHETLDYEQTLIETVRHAARLTEEAAVGFLQRFLFTYEQARGVVGNLSGGERSRLQLALLMLAQPNLLLLDEPTNNLDISSIEMLENALEDFSGAIFAISHDRYFLDRVVNRILELEDGNVHEYLGNYSDYQVKKTRSGP